MCTNSIRDIFARSYAILGEENMQSIQNASAIVFGLGGVGGHCAESLVRMGIGKLYIVDKDTVAPSNINRQIIATYKDIGKSKVEVAKKRFEEISPFTEIIAIEKFYTVEDPVNIPSDADIVLDCIDTISAKLHIMQSCAISHIPLISSMGMGNRLDPSKVVFEKLSKTSYDPLSKVMRKLTREKGIENISVVYSTEVPKNINLSNNSKKATPASLPFVPSTAGILMAYRAVNALVYNKSQLIPEFRR